MSTRYAIINPSGSNLIIELRVNNALNAGSDFNLINPDNKGIIENWKLTIDETGTGKYTLNTSSDKLDKKVLTWEILICTQNANLNYGTVEIAITQDNVSCQVTKPLLWELNDILLCNSDKKTNVKGGLIFIKN
jgi:hypothetical protein